MGPVELIFDGIGLVVCLNRASPWLLSKSWCSTLIILVAIFILTFFEDQLTGVLTAVGSRFGGGEMPRAINCSSAQPIALSLLSLSLGPIQTHAELYRDTCAAPQAH